MRNDDAGHPTDVPVAPETEPPTSFKWVVVAAAVVWTLGAAIIVWSRYLS